MEWKKYFIANHLTNLIKDNDQFNDENYVIFIFIQLEDHIILQYWFEYKNFNF